MAGSVQSERDNLLACLAKAVRKGGMMIYWDHNSCDFAYMKQKDAGRYRDEMLMLRDYMVDGHICHIEEGKKLKLGDVRLYPLLFEFNGKKCHAQRLLRRGKIRKQDQQSPTPYFFRDRETRKLVFHWLTARIYKKTESSLEEGGDAEKITVLSTFSDDIRRKSSRHKQMNVECEINHMGKEQKSKELKNKKQKDGNNESEQEDVNGLMASARATSRVTGAAPNNESIIQDNSREAPKNLIVLLDDDDPPSESEVCKATFGAENEKAMKWSGCEDVLFKCNARRDDLNSMREEERMVKMAYQYLNQGIPHFC